MCPGMVPVCPGFLYCVPVPPGAMSSSEGQEGHQLPAAPNQSLTQNASQQASCQNGTEEKRRERKGGREGGRERVEMEMRDEKLRDTL